MLDDLGKLNQLNLNKFGDPEIATRIAQYEMAFRMQTSVPELLDTSKEPERVTKAYGPDVAKRGTFAANCLLARRLCERGVRFVQLFYRGWDQHRNLPTDLPKMTRATDQPTAALLNDLKERGLLDETLVIWGGEFGRTPMGEVRKTIGRDHHIDAFTMWMAGAGVKKGFIHGETDELGFGVIDGKVHVHDLHATILHLLGFDHEQLTYRFQGRDFRLTDVHGKIVREILT